MVTSDDCITVMDSENLNTVYKFKHDNLEYPQGIHIEGNHIFVCALNALHKFNSEYQYQGQVGHDLNPVFSAGFGDGRIVYTEYRDECIKVIYT